jgi:hypothetical protein
MEALKAARVPYLVESDRDFYRTPEVIDFLNVLRVIDDPGDRVSMLGLLRSPLVLLEDRDLMALAAAGALDFRRDPPPGLPEGARNRLRVFYDRLARSAGRRPGGHPARGRRADPGGDVVVAVRGGVLSRRAERRQFVEGGPPRRRSPPGPGGHPGGVRPPFVGGRRTGRRGGGEPSGRGAGRRRAPVHDPQGQGAWNTKWCSCRTSPRRSKTGTAAPWPCGATGPKARWGGAFIERQWPDAAMAFLEADETSGRNGRPFAFFTSPPPGPASTWCWWARKNPPGIVPGHVEERFPSGGKGLGTEGRFGDSGARPIEPGDAPARPFRRAPPRGGEKRRPPTGAPGRSAAPLPGPGGPPCSRRRPARSGDDPSKNFSGERPGGPTPAEAALLGRLCHAVLERGPLAPLELTARVDDAVRRLRAEYPDAYWSVIAGEAEGMLDGFLRGDTAAAC